VTPQIKKNNDQYLVYIPRLTLPKECLNENNDLKLTMLGGRLFQTLMIRSLGTCPQTGEEVPGWADRSRPIIAESRGGSSKLNR